jgi:hypothetical protein
MTSPGLADASRGTHDYAMHPLNLAYTASSSFSLH